MNKLIHCETRENNFDVGDHTSRTVSAENVSANDQGYHAHPRFKYVSDEEANKASVVGGHSFITYAQKGVGGQAPCVRQCIAVIVTS